MSVSYALVYFLDPSTAGLADAEHQRCVEFEQAARDAGQLVHGARLHPGSDGKTVSIRDDQAAVEHGVPTGDAVLATTSSRSPTRPPPSPGPSGSRPPATAASKPASSPRWPEPRGGEGGAPRPPHRPSQRPTQVGNDARPVLASDKTARRAAEPRIQARQAARGRPRGQVRERLTAAVANFDLLAVWFSAALGYRPPPQPDTWPEAATGSSCAPPTTCVTLSTRLGDPPLPGTAQHQDLGRQVDPGVRLRRVRTWPHLLIRSARIRPEPWFRTSRDFSYPKGVRHGATRQARTTPLSARRCWRHRGDRDLRRRRPGPGERHRGARGGPSR
jgi:hypothetical protein